MPNIEYTPAQMANAIKALNVPLMEKKEITITDNGTNTIAPSSGYDGISELDMITKVRQGIPIHISNSQTEQWVRPSGWPDLDNITLGTDTDYDELYMTYDLTKAEGWGWIGLYAMTQGEVSWTVERGHLSNTEFITDELFTIQSRGIFRQALDSTQGNIQLWRLKGYHIQKYGFATNSSTSTSAFENNLQPCVEMTGRLKYVTTLQSTVGTNNLYVTSCTIWMEKYSVEIKSSALISMTNMFNGCHRLQVIDADKIDTSTVTAMDSLFSGCYSLQVVDISKWNLSAATNIRFMFLDCWSLQNIDVSKWNISAAQNLQGIFQNCYSLQNINVSDWDISAATNLINVFNGCYNLQNIDVSEWDTSAVTDMNGMFMSCYSLQEIDISQWDTSSVKTMNQMFQGCWSLQDINVSNWDISATTTISNMFNGCYSLQSIDVSNWDTSVVTTADGVFQNCYSLRTVDVSKWDVSAATNIRFIFNGCYSLQNVDVSEWDVSAATNISNIFYNCRSLQSIDISKWNMGTATTIGTMFDGCTNLITFNAGEINLSRFTSGVPTLNLGNLVTIYPFIISVNQSFNGAKKLSIDSLMRIINTLPIVSSKTLTLGQTNKLKLTAEQIAIATQKGWTVA